MWHSISSCVVPNKVLADAEKCSFRLPANDFCLAHKFFITTFFLEACLVYTWYEDNLNNYIPAYRSASGQQTFLYAATVFSTCSYHQCLLANFEKGVKGIPLFLRVCQNSCKSFNLSIVMHFNRFRFQWIFQFH